MKAHYEGRFSAKLIERDFPHIVEVVVPPGGLGTKLDAMYAFHTQHGIKPHRGSGRREEGRDYIRWCFAHATTAAAFAAAFGGNAGSSVTLS